MSDEIQEVDVEALRAEARRKTVAAMRELADQIEREETHETQESLWRLLLIPAEPGETIDGEPCQPPDILSNGSYVLSGGRIASVTVAQGPNAIARIYLSHEAAKAVAMARTPQGK